MPKPVVPLVDRPFIAYMLEWLRSHGVDDVVLSVGHMAAGVRNVLAKTVVERVRDIIDEPIVLFKGPEAALVYPNPRLRPFEDVDVLVRDAEDAHRRLLEAGELEVHVAENGVSATPRRVMRRVATSRQGRTVVVPLLVCLGGLASGVHLLHDAVLRLVAPKRTDYPDFRCLNSVWPSGPPSVRAPQCPR